MKKSLASIYIFILVIFTFSSVVLLIYAITSTATSSAAASSDTPSASIASANALHTLVPPPTMVPSQNLIIPVTGNGVCLTPMEYANQVASLGKSWEDSINDFAGVMDQASMDGNVLSDPSWQAQVEVDLTQIDTDAYQFRALKAPRGLLFVDVQLKAAASEALSFTSDARDGIRNSNITSLNNSTNHINNFNSYMKKAMAEIKKASIDDTCP